jgi:predicted phosphodiesterase
VQTVIGHAHTAENYQRRVGQFLNPGLLMGQFFKNETVIAGIDGIVRAGQYTIVDVKADKMDFLDVSLLEEIF